MVTSSQELILSVVPATFTGRLPIKGSWVEINLDEITVDVRVLGDQCERSHFAGTFAGGTAGGIFRSGRDGDS